MEPITSQSSITLVIKTPNQRVKDIEVNCLLDWTVEKLKRHLTNVYPTKPARSSQKIIYSGKLLDDQIVLKDILLENEGQQQTVHLVCTPSASDFFQCQSNSSSRDPPKTQATVPEVSSSTTTTTTTTQPDGLRNRIYHQAYPQHPYYNMYPPNLHTIPAQGQQGVVTGNASPTQSIPGQPYLPPNAHQFGHYAAAQHMAHMQWMHHMAQMMQGMPYLPMQPPLPYQQQVVHEQPPEVTPPAPAPAPAPQVPAQAQERRENRAQERNMVMNANAGGGMMQNDDDDDDEQENVRRDWLDHIYTGVRILMLLSIFWFYSSAERLVLMAVAMCVVWLLQSGWFNLQRAQRNRQPEVQANAADNGETVQEEQEVEEVEEGGEDEDANETDFQAADDDDDDDDDETDANTTSDSNNSAQPVHPGYFVVCYNFVTTFFSSLVPHGPRPIGQ